MKFIFHPLIQRIIPNRKIIIPYELILIIIATILYYFLNLGDKYEVRSIGPIPQQLPVPSIPKFFLIRLS
jgi:MFS superfamily sulfate permease-like transporter